jgi:hypothetical protein
MTVRNIAIFALLLLAGTIRCQQLQEFILPDLKPGWSTTSISPAAYGHGVIVFISLNYSSYSDPMTYYSWTSLLAATVSPQGIIDTMLLQTDGPFYNDYLQHADAHYKATTDISDTTRLYILLETHAFWGHGSWRNRIMRSRLLRVQHGTFEDLLDIGGAYNARMQRSENGGRWIVWEAYEQVYRPDSCDGRHYATLKACHISPDGSVGDTLVIGSGYDPILLSDASGNVRLLYRNSMHSRSRDGISLHSALLTEDGKLENESMLLHDLERELTDIPFSAVYGSENALHVLWPAPESLRHFILGADGILRSGLVTGRAKSGDFILTRTGDKRPVVLWDPANRHDLRLSEGVNGRLFERIIDLPGTSGVYRLSLDTGPDGVTNVLYGKERTIRVFRDPFVAAPESRELVSFSDVDLVPLDWVFALDGSLWFCVRGMLSRRNALYRLASPQLDVHAMRPFSNSLRINDFSPQPASSALRVGFELLQAGIVEYFVFDVLGRLRAEGSAGFYNEGTHALYIQIPSLSAGAYVLRLRGKGEMAQRPFIVR